jgi:hypothetical protein
MGMLDLGVLALDLLDEQAHVGAPLGTLERHQLRVRPVQVVGEEEDLLAQSGEV